MVKSLAAKGKREKKEIEGKPSQTKTSGWFGPPAYPMSFNCAEGFPSFGCAQRTRFMRPGLYPLETIETRMRRRGRRSPRGGERERERERKRGVDCQE
jgi:hypothetical protein